MDDRAGGIISIIEAIARRSDADAYRVARALERRSWPRDMADRRDPTALEWLRRWGPNRATPISRVCSCELGRCAVCN